MTPLCGRRMRRYEPVRWGIAVVEDPMCGRPAGHNGRCLSQMCMTRAREHQRAARARAAASPSPAGRRIREVRHWAGMSQQALARAVGVSQSAVSYWETDQFDPGAVMLLRIADAAGAPAEWLLPGQDGGQRAA